MGLLSKIVASLVSPLGTALVLGLLALLLARSRRPQRRRRAALLGAAAIAWLWWWSVPAASFWLRASLEDEAGPRTVEAVPAAPAMVVLGGAVNGARPPFRPYPDLTSAGDRLWYAVRLYRAGKAPLIVLSGGTVHTGEGPEAQAMQQFVADMGVPAGVVLLENRSTNTTENAAETARLLRSRGIRRILLVTSALHMRRAQGLFERAGFDVVPAPTDFEVSHRALGPRDFVPDAEALDGSARAMKEIVGRLVGR